MCQGTEVVSFDLICNTLQLVQLQFLLHNLPTEVHGTAVNIPWQKHDAYSINEFVERPKTIQDRARGKPELNMAHLRPTRAAIHPLANEPMMLPMR